MISIMFVGGEDVRMRIPILQKLAIMGFNVAVMGSEDSEPFDKVGIMYYRYELNRGVSPLCDRRSINQLVSAFAMHNPDVVHAFDTKPAMLVPVAARQAAVNCCVRTVTGMGYVFSSSSPLALLLRPIYRFMQKKASALADYTVFQNEDDMDYFKSENLVNPGKAVLVRGSGIDLDLLEKQKAGSEDSKKLREELGLANSVVVIMIARLVNHKGVIEYLKAAKKVREVLPNCRFLLVGPRGEEGRQAVSLKLIESFKESVDWLGARSDVPALLSLSDIFVLPSYYREGVPRVLLEAGGMGLPLVTTDMPGCRDVVKDGSTGLLVPIKNSELLANAIVRLAESKKMRNELGGNVKKHIAESFSLDRVADLYANLYRKIVLNKTPEIY